MRGSSGPLGTLRRVAAWALALAAIGALAGCSPDHSSNSAAGAVARVTERDFHISVTPAQVRPGKVLLRVHNLGPDNHELIVVRLGKDPIPLRADGVTVNEEALERRTVGALEPGAADSVRELRLTLTRGRYEVFCNMSGHYLGGMHTELTVS